MIQRFGESYIFVVEELPSEETSAVEPEEKKGFLEKIFGKKKDPDVDKPAEPVKQYIVKKRIVQPGILIDGVQEITSGLRAGEEFIVKGQTLLNDGSRINIIERVAPIRTER
jgi:hypothetical protein